MEESDLITGRWYYNTKYGHIRRFKDTCGKEFMFDMIKQKEMGQTLTREEYTGLKIEYVLDSYIPYIETEFNLKKIDISNNSENEKELLLEKDEVCYIGTEKFKVKVINDDEDYKYRYCIANSNKSHRVTAYGYVEGSPYPVVSKAPYDLPTISYDTPAKYGDIVYCWMNFSKTKIAYRVIYSVNEDGSINDTTGDRWDKYSKTPPII